MSGHSKWHNIQHRKGLQDAKRGKIFTKLIREITTAARLGGGDPAANPRLRAAIAEALSNNMTRDTVDRAVKRGAGGDDDGAQLETIIYEGYGPCGTAILVECLSDNKNRTAADVRHAFTKAGGNLGTPGSVSYLFTKKGEIDAFGDVLDAIEKAGMKPSSAKVAMIPSTEADIDVDHAQKFINLVDMLEDLDDVQQVYHNGSISDEVAATLE